MCFRMLVLMLMLVFVPMLMSKISIITSKSTLNCTFASVRYLKLDENYV